MLNCPLCRAGLIALAAFSINPVHASVITDATNDFLPSFTVAPHNSDLDVVSAAGFYNTTAQQFTFSATLAGALGQTPGALYVWGLDRGQGTQRFLNGSPPIGAGVFFDSVLILRPNGTGVYNDFINNTMTNLAAGSVQLNGNTITGADLPLSLFPSTGFQPGEYTWNIWPRVGLGQNNQISDFAPDAANVPVTSVPEPETYVMLLSGLGLIGALRVRRKRVQPQPQPA